MEIINYDDKVNKIKMEDIIFHGINDTNCLYIPWMILRECNYKCSYCSASTIPLSNNFIELDKLKHAVDQIFKIEKKEYRFTLLGGEITYYPYLIELIEYIDSFNKNIYIYIVTNGSKKEEYFKKLLSSIHNINFDFTISIHLEYADINHIKKIISTFNEFNKINLNIRIMAHPELKEKTKVFFNELKEFRKYYTFNLLIGELYGEPDFTEIDSRYDKDFFEWIDNSKKNVNNNEINISNAYYKINDDNHNLICISHNIALRNNLKNFNNFYCLGGINIIFIDFNGCYRNVQCSVAPLIGNIYNEDIDIYNLINYVKCDRQCTCGANDVALKYRNKSEADQCISKYRKENMHLILEQFVRESNNKINRLNDKIDILTNENISIKNNNKKLVDAIAWWIPIKKLRENFKNKFRAEQSRAEQSRAEQSRAER